MSKRLAVRLFASSPWRPTPCIFTEAEIARLVSYAADVARQHRR